MRRALPILTVGLLALFACSDEEQPTSPTVAPPLMAISDGANGGTPGFYFLPPLGDRPQSTGDFDAEVEAVVTVCEWMGTGCGPTVAVFDTEGDGAHRVRANGSEGHYIVNWNTMGSGLQTNSVYRIAVSAEGAELGFVDVMPFERGNQKDAIAEAGYYPVKAGSTLPVKFRIEVGAYDIPTATVVGVITTIGGAPLGDVAAALEGTAIVGSTNAVGGLTLDGVRTGRTAVLRLSRTGYVDQLVRLEVPNGVDQVTFRTAMTEKAAPVAVSASTGGTATSTDGASVTLPPSGLVDGSGQPVSGDVDVTVTPLDVSGDGISAFPGSFVGVNADGESGLLMSYGLAEYEFEQNGEPLQLADGATATVVIPIYTGDTGLSLGDEIPLWYLDESTGEWQEESLGTVVSLASSPTGLGLEAEVSHFSWWNIDVWVDAPYEPLVRCSVDGSPVDCTVRAVVDDPDFPRTNAESIVPAAGARLTFPPAPTVTQLSGESGNRFGSVSGGVSGPSGGGASDTIWVDLVNAGVLSPDHSFTTLTPDTTEIPGSITITHHTRDASGAPMGVGGFGVHFVIVNATDFGDVDGVAIASDNGDGTYTAMYAPTDSGTFAVRTVQNNSAFITTAEPQFTATYAADAGRGEFSTVTASAAHLEVGDSALITLEAYDASGTPKAVGGDSVSFVAAAGPLTANGSFGPVTDHGDGSYTTWFTAFKPGSPVRIVGQVNYEEVGTPAPEIGVSPRILAASEVDSTLATAFNDWWLSAHGYHVEWTMATMADGATSSWGNQAMRDMSSEPRQAWNNDPSYNYDRTTLIPWERAYSAISGAYDVLYSLNNGLDLGTVAENQRARAAAHAVQGLAHGQIALVFDKGFVLEENRDISLTTLTLRPYTEVMDSALAFLDEAIFIADNTGFTFPTNWLPPSAVSNADLSAILHSYSARFMASVARTPTERDNADWSQILTHIGQGIVTDFAPVSDGDAWYDFFKAYVHNGGWFRADNRMVGGVTPNDPETDPDGAFAAWLATPVEDRLPFTTTTADQRIWDGTYSWGDPNPGSYFTWDPNIPHRPERGTYHFSYYRFSRLNPGYSINPGDPMTAVSTVEMDLLEAEARIRLGQPGAAALINQTRVGNGGLSAASDAETDADLLEKLAYEKRLETYHLNGGLLFFERRGLGGPVAPQGFGQGLVEGTPYHFPVPGRELERLGLPNYTYGGSGAAMIVAVREGVPAADVYRKVTPSTGAPDIVIDGRGPPVREGTTRYRRH